MKEKRKDCPLPALGLLLDTSGFVRRSPLFVGHVREHWPLAGRLEALRAPAGALAVLDRGVAPDACLAWLRERGCRDPVVSRERHRPCDAGNAMPVRAQAQRTVQLRKVVAPGSAEARLHCCSAERAQKASSAAPPLSGARPRKPNPPSGPSTLRSASTRIPGAFARLSAGRPISPVCVR